MAMIYYVKDGPRPGSYGLGYKVSLLDLEAKFGSQRMKYHGLTPPVINMNSPSLSPCHVIVEIDTNDPIGRFFDKVGFFIFLDLSPEMAHKKLF